MHPVLAKTPFGKYVKAIRASPPEIYNFRLFFAVCTFAFAGQPKVLALSIGWDEGSMASIANLKSFQTHFGVTTAANPDTVSNLVSFVNLTAGVGALLSYFLNDRVGRRWSLRIYLTIYALGCLASTFSYGNIGALYFGRLLAGFGIGACTVTGPMTIVELAPTATRGLMTLWFNLAMLGSQMLGIFVVYGCSLNISSTSNLQWQIPFFVQTFVPAISIVSSFFVDESPRWLCLAGRHDEGLKALARLRGLPEEHEAVKAEFNVISTQIHLEEAEFGNPTFLSTLRETFLVRSNLRRVQLTVMAYILAQMSGANAVTNYLPTIFGLVGVQSSGAQIYSAGLYALAKLICCALASLVFVDAIGRRKSLIIGITVQMLCHTYLGSYLEILKARNNKVSQGSSDMAIAAIYIHAFGWAIGELLSKQFLTFVLMVTSLYSLPYLFGAELWPNRIRSFGGALSQGFHWIFYFAITKATPSILSSMNTYGAFFFFAAWCLVALIYTFIMVPETSGRTLESMDRLFEHPWYEMRKHAYADITMNEKVLDVEEGADNPEKTGIRDAWIEDAKK